MADQQLDAKFEKSCTLLRVKGDKLSLSDEQKLKFYGLFKQATEGKCNTSCPGFFDFTGKAKWNAWNNLGEMSSLKAKEEYIRVFLSLCPDVDLEGEVSEEEEEKGSRSGGGGGGGMGPVFSRMVFDEEEGDEEEEGNKAIFTDIIRDGNIEKLRSLLENNPEIIHEKDENGMTPLHIAADSEQLDCVKLLVQKGAPLNTQDNDGQTPLYISALCDSEEVALFLVEKGADVSIGDESGETPAQATSLASLAEKLRK